LHSVDAKIDGSLLNLELKVDEETGEHSFDFVE